MKRITFEVEDEMHIEFKEKLNSNNQKMGPVLRSWVKKYLENNEPEKYTVTSTLDVNLNKPKKSWISRMWRK